MSYEYSSESRRLDLPNPFSVENLFGFAIAGVTLLGALATLLMSRSHLSFHHGLWALAPFAVGLGLLWRGIAIARRVLTQLRFFFGRGEPMSLSSEIAHDSVGQGDRVALIKETLRQNAIGYKEPTGALNGLLYSLIRDLIFAPQRVQDIAQRQFQIGLATAATLLSFIATQLFISDANASATLGVFYFAFAVVLLLVPLDTGANARADFGVIGLVVLVLVAIFGPVLVKFITPALPDLTWLHLTTQVFVLLLCALLAIALFFVALIRQMIRPPNTTMACEQQAVSFNAHPKQLIDELERELQKDWTEQIPNRCYARVLPVINDKAGTFSGEVLQETQPMPCEDMRHLSLGAAVALPRYKWLVWLNAFGLFASLVGLLCFVIFAAALHPDQTINREIIGLAIFGAAMVCVSDFCFNAGHSLWGRFDFVSEIIWVEFAGNYQSARVDYGNIVDRFKTEKQVINIESMTLRVWVARVETASFGKYSPRMLLGMSGNAERARYLARRLAEFASEQSIIVSATSSADVAKVAGLDAMNRSNDAAPLAAFTQQVAQMLMPDPAPTPPVVRPSACPKCQTAIIPGNRFCGHCGEPLPG